MKRLQNLGTSMIHKEILAESIVGKIYWKTLTYIFTYTNFTYTFESNQIYMIYSVKQNMKIVIRKVKQVKRLHVKN